LFDFGDRLGAGGVDIFAGVDDRKVGAEVGADGVGEDPQSLMGSLGVGRQRSDIGVARLITRT